MKKIFERKEGFTLIELLAVIVILAVIMLVASTSVSGVMKNAKQGTFRNEFLSFLESAQLRANLDQMNGDHFKANSDTVCYNMEAVSQFSKSKGAGYTGSVLVKKENGAFTFTGWMSNGEFTIINKNGNLKTTDVNDFSTSTDPKWDATNYVKCGGTGTYVAS